MGKSIRIFVVQDFDEKRTTARQARQIAKRTGRWVVADGVSYDEVNKAASVTDAFYMIRPFIPKGYHPVTIEDASSEP